MKILRKILDGAASMFKRKKTKTAPVTTTPVTTAPVITTKTPLFEDSFSTLNLNEWIVSTWTAPGKQINHAGRFDASHVYVKDGVLCLKLSQLLNENDGSITSIGGEISTRRSFGFGTYEMEVKASSTAIAPSLAGIPVSGSITGVFNYAPKSITEIDYEVEGCQSRCQNFQMTSWHRDTAPNEHTSVGPANGELPHHRFFKIKFIWTPGKIEYYRDDVLVATHTKVVPQTACPFLFNHWGTNSENWGGLATPGIDRYMYVKNFKFTPL